MEWQHIYPVNDIIDHKLEGLDCICEPRIDWEYMLVIHNSADGREEKEETGVECGKCKGEIYFISCPIHHWAVSSKCLKCGEVVIIDSKCKECCFPHSPQP